MRDIKIKPALNGYICIVGCQTLVFTDREFMLKEIGKYLVDPIAVEKEYIGKAVNKTDGLPVETADVANTACDGAAGRGLGRVLGRGEIARGVAYQAFGVNEQAEGRAEQAMPDRLS